MDHRPRLAAACALVDEQAVHVALPERELHRLLVWQQLAGIRHLSVSRFVCQYFIHFIVLGSQSVANTFDQRSRDENLTIFTVLQRTRSTKHK